MRILDILNKKLFKMRWLICTPFKYLKYLWNTDIIIIIIVRTMIYYIVLFEDI